MEREEMVRIEDFVVFCGDVVEDKILFRLDGLWGGVITVRGLPCNNESSHWGVSWSLASRPLENIWFLMRRK